MFRRQQPNELLIRCVKQTKASAPHVHQEVNVNTTLPVPVMLVSVLALRHRC